MAGCSHRRQQLQLPQREYPELKLLGSWTEKLALSGAEGRMFEAGVRISATAQRFMTELENAEDDYDPLANRILCAMSYLGGYLTQMARDNLSSERKRAAWKIIQILEHEVFSKSVKQLEVEGLSKKRAMLFWALEFMDRYSRHPPETAASELVEQLSYEMWGYNPDTFVHHRRRPTAPPALVRAAEAALQSWNDRHGAKWDTVNLFLAYYGLDAKAPTPSERKRWPTAKRAAFEHPLAAEWRKARRWSAKREAERRARELAIDAPGIRFRGDRAVAKTHATKHAKSRFSGRKPAKRAG